MGDKIKAFLKNSVGYIVATLTTLAYVMLSYLQLDRTGKSLDEIIGSGIAFYILQIILITLFLYQGLSNGERDERVQATNELHGEKVLEIADSMDALDSWCEQENAENYKRERTIILAKAGISYSDYFSDNGVVLPYEVDVQKLNRRWKNRFIRRQEKKKIHAYNRAVKLKLSEINTTMITSNNKATRDKFSQPKQKTEFIRGKLSKSSLVKALPALFFGLWGFKSITDWTWTNFAWLIFQAMVAYAGAIPQMFAGRNYMVDDYRGGVVKKIGYIDKFACDFKNNPEKYRKTKNKESVVKTDTKQDLVKEKEDGRDEKCKDQNEQSEVS
ncbi:MAG: hypothetical protein IJY05_03215 [Clostridia bacterium]|nr:hypothetical protein [Clostridia bacterium]